MKVAMQHTGLIGHSSSSKPTDTQKSKIKDGSAHPHAGSHAQVRHFIYFFLKAIFKKFTIFTINSITIQ